jgi:ribosomal protein L37AE/L43A
MDASKNKASLDPLNIVCPVCTEENSLEYGSHISCNKCEKTFAGHTYKKFKVGFYRFHNINSVALLFIKILW